jgi:magnesium chelatase family protein
MFARVKTVAFCGITAELINVEVHIFSGLPSFNIVGLANKAVSEAKERVKSALLMMGVSLPAKKITVNLSPANIYKDGNHYDLAIAIGILCALGVLNQEQIEKFIFLGELSLNGDLNPIYGILCAGNFAFLNELGLAFPLSNEEESTFINTAVPLIASHSLKNLMQILSGELFYERSFKYNPKQQEFSKDFKDVKGQKQAKRAFEIASIGGHDVLMIGRPGSGKSMLAERMPSILSSPNSEELLEISIINSISGNTENITDAKRPFRSPHHSSSMVSLIGGGRTVKPGEITLAHNGILFLDEFAEFPSFVLDALRTPMETNEVHIARAEGHVTFPCKFQLIAAMNPCKCGYLGDAKKECSKVPLCGENYMQKVSGPILERIDIHISVNPAFQNSALSFEKTEEESSKTILERVKNVKKFITEERGQNEFSNSKIPSSRLEEFCNLTEDVIQILNSASEKFHFSLRELHKVIKVSRTIADMEFSKEIMKKHILEALNYRSSSSKSALN